MLAMPVLETERLLIRPFAMADLAEAHRLFDIDLKDYPLHTDKLESLEERREWLQWASLNHRQLALLYQPPYGDRAVVLKSIGEIIGSVGYVPCLMPFEQIPGLAQGGIEPDPARATPEMGLFYAISPAHRRQGYAEEAVQALIDYAFHELNLKRIVATTDYDNLASMGVMRKLGMRVEKNPLPEPPYLQVVGVLENH